MKDPRMDMENHPMPFDGKRMIFGGFSPAIDVAVNDHPHPLPSGISSHARAGGTGQPRPARH